MKRILFFCFFLLLLSGCNQGVAQPETVVDTVENISAQPLADNATTELTEPVVEEKVDTTPLPFAEPRVLEDIIAKPKPKSLKDVEFEVHDLDYEKNSLRKFTFTIQNHLSKKIRPYIDIYAIDEELEKPVHITKVDIEEVLPGQLFEGNNWTLKKSVDKINQEITFKLMHVDLQKGKTVLGEEIILIDAKQELIHRQSRDR